MSTAFLCPFCGSATPADKKFCKKCGKGLHCPNPECKAPLETGADFCVECGHSYQGEIRASESSHDSQRNEFDYFSSQQGRNRVVRASLRLSDRGMEAVAPFAFEQLITSQSAQLRPVDREISKKGLPAPPADQGDLFSQDAEFFEHVEIPADRPAELKTESSTVILPEGAAVFFERSGEFLVPKRKDFNGKTWAEQQRNYIVLYLYAYNQIFNKTLSLREHFKEAAVKANIYDPSNFSKQVEKQVNAYMMEVDGGLKLNSDGEKEVKRILSLMNDPKAEPGYLYWKRDSNATTERHRLTDKNKIQLDEWAKEEVDLGKLDIRDVKTGRDYAIIAFWILTSKLKKGEAIHRSEAVYFLKKKYAIVSVTPEAFSKAVLADEKEVYFRKSDEKHFLTSEAIRIVESWYNGTPVGTIKVTSEEHKS